MKLSYYSVGSNIPGSDFHAGCVSGHETFQQEYEAGYHHCVLSCESPGYEEIKSIPTSSAWLHI